MGYCPYIPTYVIICVDTYSNLRELCWVKKNSRKIVYCMIWLIIICQNYTNEEQFSECQGLQQESGASGSKRATRGILWVIELLSTLTLSMSISWLSEGTTVLQDGATEVHGISVLLLTTVCKFTVIWKQKSNWKKSELCRTHKKWCIWVFVE